MERWSLALIKQRSRPGDKISRPPRLRLIWRDKGENPKFSAPSVSAEASDKSCSDCSITSDYSLSDRCHQLASAVPFEPPRPGIGSFTQWSSSGVDCQYVIATTIPVIDPVGTPHLPLRTRTRSPVIVYLAHLFFSAESFERGICLLELVYDQHYNPS